MPPVRGQGLAITALLGGLLLGAVASTVAGGPLWLRTLDLVVGLALGVAATLARRRVVELALWAAMLGRFAADVLPAANGAHRVALVLAGASAWVAAPRLRAAAVAASALAAVPALDASPWPTAAALAVLLLGGWRRAAWLTPLLAVLGLHAVVVWLPVVPADSAVLVTLGYDALVIAAGAAAAGWTVQLQRRRERLSGQVIEAAGGSMQRLQRALADALGDPDLRFDRSTSEPADLEVRVPGTSAVRVRSEVLRGNTLLAAPVRDAIVLSLTHDALRRDLAATLARSRAAGRRVLEADDQERAAIAARITAGPLPLLQEAYDGLAEGDAMAATRDRLRLAMVELRGFGDRLTPLAGTDLVTALDDLAGAAPGNLAVRVRSTHVDLPPVAAQTLYYVCAEALANVMKHARATTVDIELRGDAHLVTLVVHDDGTGFDTRLRGSGLTGLADRLSILAGSLTLDCPPGGGTTLVARVPR